MQADHLYAVRAIENRSYKPLFLNPIEEDQKAYKNYSALTFRYTLTTRIKVACETIATNDCVRWIRQFETY